MGKTLSCTHTDGYEIWVEGKLTCDQCILAGKEPLDLNEEQLVMYMAAGYGNVTKKAVHADRVGQDGWKFEFEDNRQAKIFWSWCQVNNFIVSSMNTTASGHIYMYYWKKEKVNDQG